MTLGPDTPHDRVAPENVDEFRGLPAPLLEKALRRLHDTGARFVSTFEVREERITIVAHRGELLVLRSDDPSALQLRVAEWWPAAAAAEQELAGVLVPDADVLPRRVRGDDIFVMPYGPIRSGVFEAIQFVIETGGEDVPNVSVRPFFKRREREARFTGMPVLQGVHVAERVAGIASVAYATAYSQAVEQALGVQAPLRAQRWRALYAELERIANHFDVIARQAETTALSVGQARFQILKERTQRLLGALTGSRFGRGVVVPGGVRFDGRLTPEEMLEAIGALERELRVDRRMFRGTASMTDRLAGTGMLDRALLELHGAVGPLARGSGLSVDARHERPYGDYRRLGLEVRTSERCDALGRVEVRFGEIAESLRMLRQIVHQLRTKDGGLAVPLPDADADGCGWTEAPQGELVVWVRLGPGRVEAVRIASPSRRNWGLLEHAFPHDVLTDFAFIEHSFGLTAAGADR